MASSSQDPDLTMLEDARYWHASTASYMTDLLADQSDLVLDPAHHLDPLDEEAFSMFTHGFDDHIFDTSIDMAPHAQALPPHLSRNSSTDSSYSESDPPESPATGGRKSKVEPTERRAKRREQNRASQQAYRDRQRKLVTDLETKIGELAQKSTSLGGENEMLKRRLERMMIENQTLKLTCGIANRRAYVQRR
ncbi:uncharacterized protein AB675_3559 [Cyphellophora attinorum]|uniref:BZIP domain-containing protein n=1 Tax=Cyphellophora attinorum TaxID=1664694 RepID=A0A0N1HAP5_9EURO|nr:uncharacterized protein AB675_3559 [Phialophora attinorum]KPI39846.1 hypothetical protein AB675_3559 [Phialophora attinorum]